MSACACKRTRIFCDHHPHASITTTQQLEQLPVEQLEQLEQLEQQHQLARTTS
jgi:hypothetical protein